ncbi:hypothetical protein FQN50_009379 [Emmonsiellopsis sp. PD_5]|nr:hypothetical protein FQN50_009379 [Emmonsiellopsis sp. PD_5]
MSDKARGRNTATANDLEDQQQSETEKTESASPSEHEVLSDHDSDSTAARSDSSSERSDLFTLDVWDLLDVFAAYEIVVDENVDYRAWLERFLYNMESRLRANFYWSHQLVASWDLEASVGEGAFA